MLYHLAADTYIALSCDSSELRKISCKSQLKEKKKKKYFLPRLILFKKSVKLKHS